MSSTDNKRHNGRASFHRGISRAQLLSANTGSTKDKRYRILPLSVQTQKLYTLYPHKAGLNGHLYSKTVTQKQWQYKDNYQEVCGNGEHTMFPIGCACLKEGNVAFYLDAMLTPVKNHWEENTDGALKSILGRRERRKGQEGVGGGESWKWALTVHYKPKPFQKLLTFSQPHWSGHRTKKSHEANKVTSG